MGSTKRQPAQPDRTSVALLRSYAERIVRLREEIKGLQSDIKDIKTEADGQGFDKKALMVIVSRLMESETDKAKRVATESYADIYLASLGMLDGTPLGDAARRHLMNPPRDPEDEGEQPGDEGGESDEDRADMTPDDQAAAPSGPPAGAMSQEMVDAAREEGAAGARSGAGVFANPYVAGDPRRAAWDEGWCRETGSDGMDLPAAFRRPSKPRKGDADRRPGGER